MHVKSPGDLKVIGDLIRSTVKAEAERYFKSESNTQERSAFVAVAITSRMFVALLDSGLISAEQLLSNVIDPTDEVLAAMKTAGFVVEGPAIGEEDDGLREVFGPVRNDGCVTC